MKNKLSVWTYSYRKSYYLTHPWKWFKDTYWNFRNWWHRGKYGFAYVDAWNWSNWWTEVGAAALRYMADHGSGYPGVEPWETPEKWKDFLHKTADDLDWCSKSCDWDEDDDNEYASAMHSIWEKALREKDGNWTFTLPDDEIKERYYARMKEIQEEKEKKRSEMFAEIGRILPRYWD